MAPVLELDDAQKQHLDAAWETARREGAKELQAYIAGVEEYRRKHGMTKETRDFVGGLSEVTSKIKDANNRCIGEL